MQEIRYMDSDQEYILLYVMLKAGADPEILDQPFTIAGLQDLRFKSLYGNQYDEPKDYGPGKDEAEVWQVTRGSELIWSGGDPDAVRFVSGEGIPLLYNFKEDLFVTSIEPVEGYERLRWLFPDVSIVSWNMTLLEVAILYDSFRSEHLQEVSKTIGTWYSAASGVSTISDTDDLPF